MSVVWWCSDGPLNSQEYKSFEMYACGLYEDTIQHGSTRNPLQVNSGDTIGRLKQQIQSLIGVHPDQQQLLMGSTALQDTSRTIASYNVRSGSVITVGARLRGGGGGLVY